MELGFIASRKIGVHYELATFAVKHLKTANIALKAQKERSFEHTIVSHLQASRKLRKNLITQVDEEDVEKISQASLFGFRHRPDVTIGKDGTAIEIKVVSNAPAARDVLGQGLTYRMHYRFVILMLVDHTPDRETRRALR